MEFNKIWRTFWFAGVQAAQREVEWLQNHRDELASIWPPLHDYIGEIVSIHKNRHRLGAYCHLSLLERAYSEMGPHTLFQEINGLLDGDRLSLQPPTSDWNDLARYPKEVALMLITPASTHPRERTFLPVLQASFVSFRAILDLCNFALKNGAQADWTTATADIGAASEWASKLNIFSAVAKTIAPEEFCDFRQVISEASAVQYRPFQELDALLGGLRNPQKLEALSQIDETRNVRTTETLLDLIQFNNPPEAFLEAFGNLVKKLLQWNGMHLSVAKRFIGVDASGSGGTLGVAYLANNLKFNLKKH